MLTMPGVAGRLGPLLVVGVVGQGGLLGVRDDPRRASSSVSASTAQSPAMANPPMVVAPEAGSAASPLAAQFCSFTRAPTRGVGVGDLDDHGHGRAVGPEVDGGDRGAVAEPGLDVVLVVEVGAGVVAALDLVEDPPAHVVVGLEPQLVLELRELVEGPHRLDLLPAAGVQVDARRRPGCCPGSASAGWAPVEKKDIAAHAAPPTTARPATAAPPMRTGLRLRGAPEPGSPRGAPPPCSRYSGPPVASVGGSDGGRLLDTWFPLDKRLGRTRGRDDSGSTTRLPVGFRRRPASGRPGEPDEAQGEPGQGPGRQRDVRRDRPRPAARRRSR